MDCFSGPVLKIMQVLRLHSICMYLRHFGAEVCHLFALHLQHQRCTVSVAFYSSDHLEPLVLQALPHVWPMSISHLPAARSLNHRISWRVELLLVCLLASFLPLFLSCFISGPGIWEQKDRKGKRRKKKQYKIGPPSLVKVRSLHLDSELLSHGTCLGIGWVQIPHYMCYAATRVQVAQSRCKSSNYTCKSTWCNLVPVPKLQPALHPMWLTAPKVLALVSNFRINTCSKSSKTHQAHKTYKTYNLHTRLLQDRAFRFQSFKVPSQEVTVPTIACSQFSLKSYCDFLRPQCHTVSYSIFHCGTAKGRQEVSVCIAYQVQNVQDKECESSNVK